MARELLNEQEKRLIEQWLKTNKITICEAGAVTENIEYTFGSKKKKKTAGPKKEMTVKEMKQEIIRLHAEKEALRQEKDKKKLDIIRRRINRLKKMTRKAA